MKNTVLLSLTLTLISLLSLSAQEKDTLWYDGFEGNWIQNWHVSQGTWEVGTPTTGPQSAFKGNICAATVLNGNYIQPAESRLIRHKEFVVPAAAENPRLRFWEWFSFSSKDWGEVHIKTEHGEWENIHARKYNVGGNVWTQTLIDLSAYSDSLVTISFLFHSQDDGYAGSDVSTGWYIDEVLVETGPYTFNMYEDFELGMGDWSVDRGTWEIGSPASGPGQAYSGLSCAATVLGGTYQQPSESSLISPPFVVPSLTSNPRLCFYNWFSFNSSDYGEVLIRTKNGDWIPVTGNIIRSGSGVWSKGYVDLLKYADSTIQIAFHFKAADDGYAGDDVSHGWFLDDVQIETGTYVTNNPEGFETGIGDWYVDRGTWEVGIPTVGPENPQSGRLCAGTNLGGNYRQPVSTRLISPLFTVPDASMNPAFVFWHWFKFSSSDYGEIHISTDNGETWETLTEQAITQTSTTWSPYYLSLAPYSNLPVRVGFFFKSADDGYAGDDVSDGWFIDEITIIDDSELLLYAGTDIDVDPCGSANLHATLSGGTEPYIIEWSPSAGLDDPGSLDPIASPTDTTVYTVRVTDATGCFRTDWVVVNAHCEAASSETGILSFSLGKPPQVGEVAINREHHSVDALVQYGTDISGLTATFSLSEGATAAVNGVSQTSGYTVNDFTDPVTYTITAEDGTTTQDWVVTVEVAEPDPPDFLSFSFGQPPQTGAAFIDANAQTVGIKVEHGTDRTALVASFSIPQNAVAKVGEVVQESGVTPNDFSNPLTYTITADDGSTTKEWVVTVVEAALYETDILSFGFDHPPQVGEALINPVDHKVDMVVEHGTDLTQLVATFTLSEGASAKLGDVLQESGVSSNDFTNPVTYTVTASDGETVQNWTVSVKEEILIGVGNNSLFGLRIYPNPFSDRALIQVDYGEQTRPYLSLYNAQGRAVIQDRIIESETITLKKGNLPAGIYLVVIKGESCMESRVVIIQ